MNPIKARLDDHTVEVFAWGAEPFIKKALSLDSDVWIYVKARSTERTLMHNASLRPVTKLPWPLSKTQPHKVQLTITSDKDMDDLIEFAGGSNTWKDINVVFEWSKIDAYIKAFLHKLDKNAVVTIRIA